MLQSTPSTVVAPGRSNARSLAAVFAAAVAALTVAAPSTAEAGMTAIGRAPAVEHTHAQILNTLYGGTFRSLENDFFNGTISARRVDDGMSYSTAMSMARGTIGDATDETWAGSRFTARAVAKFSDNTQNLAIAWGSGNLASLFTATGYGYNVTGSATFDATGRDAHFVRSGDSGTHYSITGMNDDGRDHMITYEILGLAGVNEKVWLTFWEDLSRTPALASKRTHSDYNDLVVEMRATAVPLPAAAWGAMALGGGAFALRKRARRFVRV